MPRHVVSNNDHLGPVTVIVCSVSHWISIMHSIHRLWRGIVMGDTSLWKINRNFFSTQFFYNLSSVVCFSWWRHQMETFSPLRALCLDNSPVARELRSQRPVMQSFDVFFDLRLNERLSKQSWGWWFETPSRPLWRHYNVVFTHNVCGVIKINFIDFCWISIIGYISVTFWKWLLGQNPMSH